MLIRLTCLTIAAILMTGMAFAAPTYDPSPFGINGLKLIHARQDPNVWENAEKTAKVMRGAAIGWDRLELWWGVVEPEKGQFDWAFADKAAEFYRNRNMNAMVILCYSSAWSGGKPPTDAEERARYANYVYEVVNRYRSTYRVWEIWNEPNIPTFWKEPNAEHYALMLKEACKAAKRADPTCTVLAGCTSGADLGFVKGIRKHGGWDYCDAISIHPYSMSGGPVPQQLDRILRITQGLIASTGKPKPLWITEMGWMTPTPGMNDPQAVYLFQSYVIALANGVEKLFWFDLADWAEKWGIVRAIDPLDAKPAYTAYRTLTRYLGNMVFDGYMKMPEGIVCYAFRSRPGSFGTSEHGRLLVLWSNDGRTTSIPVPGDVRLPVWDIMGKRVETEDGRATISPTPIMIQVTDIRKVGPVSANSNPYVEAETRNLLTNGSLDDIHGSHPGWWNAGRFDGTAKDGKLATSDEGRGGSKCVSIAESGKRAAWDACMVPVVSGRKYKLTAWVKAKDATGRNCAALYWYSGNMWTYQGEVRSESVTGTRDWTRVTVTGTPPEDTTFVRVNLVSEDNSGTAWFDDISLTEE